ncbi:MAG TPA: four helix bundle protein [Cyclobacteriaceae bacterium]|nr:four helix bundle protein [Cyclobacteriaceae bacterium]
MSKKITRFEDLKCWKLARELVGLVFRVCDEGKLSKDFETKAQFKRAAMSVMNNIAEGFGRHGNKDFIRFLDIAQSSSIEVKSMTYALEDMKYLNEEKVKEIRDKAEETKNSILAFIKYLRNREDK